MVEKRGVKSSLTERYTAAIDAYLTHQNPWELAEKVGITRKQENALFSWLDTNNQTETARELGTDPANINRQIKKALQRTQRFIAEQAK